MNECVIGDFCLSLIIHIVDYQCQIIIDDTMIVSYCGSTGVHSPIQSG